MFLFCFYADLWYISVYNVQFIELNIKIVSGNNEKKNSCSFIGFMLITAYKFKLESIFRPRMWQNFISENLER